MVNQWDLVASVVMHLNSYSEATKEGSLFKKVAALVSSSKIKIITN